MRGILGSLLVLGAVCACESPTEANSPDDVGATGSDYSGGSSDEGGGSGPDGTHMVSCGGSIEGCLTKAREVCKGNYHIESTSADTKSGFMHDEHDMVVTCSGGSLADRLNPKGTTPRSEFAESDAPLGAGGVEFASAADALSAKCDAGKFKWKLNGETATCSGLLEDVGYPGSLRVKFCDAKVCEIRLRLELAPAIDTKQLITNYGKLHAALVDKYGKPQSATAQVIGTCKVDLLSCLKDDSAKLNSVWHWKNGVKLTLRMFADDGHVLTNVEYVSGKQTTSSGL